MIGLIALALAIAVVDELQEVGVDHAFGVTEQFAEKRKRPGETLEEWSCGLVDPSNDDLIRCDARYTNGRGYVLHFRRIKGGEELSLDRVVPRPRR
jgi:hypothetical protein